MSYPIADMFTRITNAHRAGHGSVLVPYSKIKMEFAKVLQSRGYIKEVGRRGRKNKKVIEIQLQYNNDKPAIHNIRSISKPSRRVYSGWEELKTFRFGRGDVIVTTPKGIMTSREAQKQKIGGEVLAHVW